MSGPSLRKLDAHRAIHDGAFMEAQSLTEMLNQLVEEKKEKEALQVADALIEHWEKRVITHADSEEEGLYKEVVEKEPEMQDKINMLTRDHDLLRIIAKKIRESLEKDSVSKEVLDFFASMLVVNEIHSRNEESWLLDYDHHHD
ncbi:hemerythrin domain-containing protein [Bacillus niameyensis]|uniref:hemerythrin domain-containing protein n=1 Tax=Bacillus niameyensis TaxID=1522308 RepID=UPI000780CC52|nr:hemerythrin domain-containing protein [Bacillus niameyensis]